MKITAKQLRQLIDEAIVSRFPISKGHDARNIMKALAQRFNLKYINSATNDNVDAWINSDGNPTTGPHIGRAFIDINYWNAGVEPVAWEDADGNIETLDASTSDVITRTPDEFDELTKDIKSYDDLKDAISKP